MAGVIIVSVQSAPEDLSRRPGPVLLPGAGGATDPYAPRLPAVLRSFSSFFFFFSPSCGTSAVNGLSPIGNTGGCHCRRRYLPSVLSQVDLTSRPGHVWSGRSSRSVTLWPRSSEFHGFDGANTLNGMIAAWMLQCAAIGSLLTIRR